MEQHPNISLQHHFHKMPLPSPWTESLSFSSTARHFDTPTKASYISPENNNNNNNNNHNHNHNNNNENAGPEPSREGRRPKQRPLRHRSSRRGSLQLQPPSAEPRKVSHERGVGTCSGACFQGFHGLWKRLLERTLVLDSKQQCIYSNKAVKPSLYLLPPFQLKPFRVSYPKKRSQ